MKTQEELTREYQTLHGDQIDLIHAAFGEDNQSVMHQVMAGRFPPEYSMQYMTMLNAHPEEEPEEPDLHGCKRILVKQPGAQLQVVDAKDNDVNSLVESILGVKPTVDSKGRKQYAETIVLLRFVLDNRNFGRDYVDEVFTCSVRPKYREENTMKPNFLQHVITGIEHIYGPAVFIRATRPLMYLEDTYEDWKKGSPMGYLEGDPVKTYQIIDMGQRNIDFITRALDTNAQKCLQKFEELDRKMEDVYEELANEYG